MRNSRSQKEETRNNLLGAALDSFRSEGYHGIGVDGIAKAAGVTSGAFYKHFASKSEAFRRVISQGLSILRFGIGENQRLHGANWLPVFVKWYFSLPKDHAHEKNRMTLPYEGGCALPTLSPEIPRTDVDTQQLFEEELLRLVTALSAGLPKENRQKKRIAWTLLALMIGGIILSRSVRNEKTASEISKSVVASIKLLTA